MAIVQMNYVHLITPLLTDGWDWSDAHDCGFAAGHSVPDDTGQRGQVVLSHRLLATEEFDFFYSTENLTILF